ncbi:TraR/DksA family transcriptional regulator [Alkalispirochaeta americana]|nr:TraR/DksA C4-type zinc finger protein [Alkalispirochaeta americana]
MTKEDLLELAKRIEEETMATQQSIPYLTRESLPVEPSVALGRLTRMEAINDKGVNEEMLRQAQRRLERLNNATKRMKDGCYGLCIRCKKEIAFERLKAIPEALMCIACADKSSTR